MRPKTESFEYEATRTGVRYTAPEGLHDDCVVALALANEKGRKYCDVAAVFVHPVPRPAPGFEGSVAQGFEIMRRDPNWGWERVTWDHGRIFRN